MVLPKLQDLFSSSYLVLVLVIISSKLLALISGILLAEGASTATPEDVESKRAQLQEAMQELDELRKERERVNEQHCREGDIGDPNEENTGQYLEQLDDLIHTTMEVIVELIN